MEDPLPKRPKRRKGTHTRKYQPGYSLSPSAPHPPESTCLVWAVNPIPPTVPTPSQAGYHALFWVMAIAFPDMAMSFSAFAFNEVAMPMLIGPLTVKLPFERSQEYEADYIGTVFASRAGHFLV